MKKEKSWVYKLKFWNFELITKMPSPLLSPLCAPSSMAGWPCAEPPAKTAFPAPGFSPTFLGLATRHRLPARTPRMAARGATATMCQAGRPAPSPLSFSFARAVHVPDLPLHSLPIPEPNRARPCTPERRRAPWLPPPPLPEESPHKRRLKSDTISVPGG